MSEPEPIISQLNSGLRVITDPMPSLKSAALGIWVDVGARHERPFEHGLSHLLEHMAFKGTRSRSARAIVEEIENVGGHLNAYTSRDQTAYFARCLAEDVPLAMDLLADILQNSVFAEEELAREKSVILQEIGEAHDTPDDLVFDLLQEAAYPDQPMGRPILGTSESVKSFDRDAVQSYLGAHYAAPRMVLAAAGGLDHEQVVAEANDRLRALPLQADYQPEPAEWQGGSGTINRKLEQLHLTLALPGVAYDHEDFYAMQVLGTLFGGGMSSRLFQKVREEMGLAYSVFSFASAFQDGGMFGIYAGTAPKDVVDLPKVIFGELEAVARDLEAPEVERAKAQLKASLLMSLESPSSRCEAAARQLFLFGRPQSVAEVAAEVDAVDVSQLRALAERILKQKDLAVGAVGPLKHLPDREVMRGLLG